jgi:HD-GYP domain-containing protein (c-di-GMP phosphodiesterase class II)
MIAQHHERRDGSADPAGLAGDEIRREAQLIAVADVFEPTSTHRPYRAAVGTAAALVERRRGQATQFAVTVVDARLRAVPPDYWILPRKSFLPTSTPLLRRIAYAAVMWK